MRRTLLSATALALLLSAPLHAQTATDGTAATDATATGDAATGDAAAATGTAPAAAPPPQYNGQISGSSSGNPFSAEVVCSGFAAGGGVTVQSDPGGGQQDINGDGIMADITADPSGAIALTLLVANSQIGLTDTSAQIEGNTLRYSIVMDFVGGGSETVELTVTCNE